MKGQGGFGQVLQGQSQDKGQGCCLLQWATLYVGLVDHFDAEIEAVQGCGGRSEAAGRSLEQRSLRRPLK